MSKLTSAGKVGKNNGDSREQVRRYIRLTYLIPELLHLVDNSVIYKKGNHLTLGLTTAVELSYLSKDAQKLLFYTIEYEDLTPSRAQALKIRNLADKNKLNFDLLEKILGEEKGNQHEQIYFNKERIMSVLPQDILKRDKRYIEEYIVNVLLKYKNHH